MNDRSVKCCKCFTEITFNGLHEYENSGHEIDFERYFNFHVKILTWRLQVRYSSLSMLLHMKPSPFSFES